MYCPNCGCNNDDNAEICQICGANLQEATKGINNPNKKKLIAIIASVVLAVAIIAGAIAVGINSHKKSEGNNSAGYQKFEIASKDESQNDEQLEEAQEAISEESTAESEISEENQDNQIEITSSENNSDGKSDKSTTKASSKNSTSENTTAAKSTLHTEYRYREKSFTTSSKSSLSGWTLYDTTYEWSNYGSWSGWSTTKYSSSNTRQVDSRTTYRFYAFKCTKCGNRDPYNTPCDNCKTSQYFQWVELWYPTKGNSMTKHTLSTVPDKYYVYIDGVMWWFERDGYSDGQGGKGQPSRTEYRYRDRTQIATYHYYKWSDWSQWSTTPVSSSANREVETRKVS